jgi:hypothetical protein
VDEFPSFASATVGSFEAVMSAISALLYLFVAAAALAKAPRDGRVRAFVVLALANVAPLLVPVLFWYRGAVAFTRPLIFALALSLTVGSLVLFHFFQIFPWRRPWIREHGRWLVAGYVIGPIVVALLMGSMPDDLLDLTETQSMIALVVGVPAMMGVGIILPFAGLFSLYKSWLTSTRLHIEAARTSLLGILVSQLAGGILSILVIPLLHLVLREGSLLTITSALLLIFGLLMPIAFWLAVWYYQALDIDPHLEVE